MNNAEAKFILQGYRPNGADAGDAAFCAAVDQARNDPALNEWFARQVAFDAAIAGKLNEVAPPPDLRAAILAGGRVTAAEGPARRGGNPLAWLGVAAGLAACVAVGLTLWPRQAERFDQFAFDDSLLGAIHGHGDRGAMTNALQWTLSQPTTKLGGKIPVDFSALAQNGCRVVKYRGHDVLEVCFNRNGSWFHCYIARVADFPHAGFGPQPVLEDKGRMSQVAWRDAEHLFVVVSKDGRQRLESLL